MDNIPERTRFVKWKTWKTMSRSHPYAVYRFFAERDEALKGWIQEGGMTVDVI